MPSPNPIDSPWELLGRISLVGAVLLFFYLHFALHGCATQWATMGIVARWNWTSATCQIYIEEKGLWAPDFTDAPPDPTPQEKRHSIAPSAWFITQ